MGQKAISVVDPSLWNSLPELIKNTDNSNTFNSFMTGAVIIQKPVHWFAEQINELVSI